MAVANVAARDLCDRAIACAEVFVFIFVWLFNFYKSLYFTRKTTFFEAVQPRKTKEGIDFEVKVRAYI
jgi:hypothetical protein